MRRRSRRRIWAEPARDKHLVILVVLRLNRSFMEFMREHYFTEIKALQPFNMTVVVEAVAVDGAE